MRGWCSALLLIGCAKTEPAPPAASAVQSVSVAPQSTGSPHEPVLLVGPRKPLASGDRVTVVEGAPDASWKAPKDRCPDGVTEMIAVHVPLGDTIELGASAAPVSALGSSEAAEVVYDRTRGIVQITARKYGLLFVLTERAGHCVWYGVNSGY